MKYLLLVMLTVITISTYQSDGMIVKQLCIDGYEYIITYQDAKMSIVNIKFMQSYETPEGTDKFPPPKKCDMNKGKE